jgi:zinc protease
MKIRARAVALVTLLLLPTFSLAQQKIEFTRRTLPNGLRVIYAPLHNAPVVSVHVLYHVGSRDERPDRQGFAHMFEHMMFRGSAHVASEEHSRMITAVGGSSNAYTSFDETVYHETLPANQLELALWLEADRMASFKVSDEIFQTERNVVVEEWRRGRNQPYGTVYQDFLAHAFTTHPYRWTPIGDMDHLRAARVEELQDFFNTYYVPNNAILVVSGDFDPAAAHKVVEKYFAWIPPANSIPRNIPAEPEQTKARSFTLTQPVPLPLVAIGYHVPPQRHPDQYALTLLSSILGDGGSSRLERNLVHGKDPICSTVMSLSATLEDPGIIGFGGLALAGKDPAAVEKGITSILYDTAKNGVTQEELDKAKTQYRTARIKGRQTADDLAGQLGSEALINGDPGRVNTDLAAVEAVTLADVRRVAQTYFRPDNATTMTVKSSLLGMLAAKVAAATQPAVVNAPVAPSTRPVETRQINFPSDYPTQPPLSTQTLAADFNKGTEHTVRGVRVVVLEDRRLPLVSFGITIPGAGSHAEPAGKEGAGDLTAELLRRGTTTRTREQLDTELDSRGIWVGAFDGGDFLRVSANCTTDQLDYAATLFTDILLHPSFPEEEFTNLKNQTLSNLQVSLEEPGTVATRELNAAVYQGSPLGRLPTPESIQSITLDDIRAYHKRMYHPGKDAFILVSGDVTKDRALALADQFLKDLSPATPPAVEYALPPAPTKPRIILVDHPDAKQAMIRMAIPAYTVQSPDKYKGAVAAHVLSGDIDARLGRDVRSAKGLAYSVWATFRPNRHAGTFSGGTETKLETAGAAVQAMLDVFADMTRTDVPADELARSKTSITGSMVMGMQTIDQQASMRGTAILNGYPPDYYDQYPAHIAAVTPAQVREVMAKYVDPNKLTVVVVAPAAQVKAQLEKIAPVETIPMPARRQKAVPASGK